MLGKCACKSYCEENEDGDIYCYDVNGKLHSEEDRPAIISKLGGRMWFYHGKNDRDGDRPAIVHPDGRWYWAKAGKVYRIKDRKGRIVLENNTNK